MLQFKVTRQYARGGEDAFAQFKELSDAQKFVAAKLSEDAALKVTVIYRISDRGVVIEEFGPDNAKPVETGSQGKGSSAAFRPTPFNTAPRPSGMPQKWLKDEDDEKKK